MYENILLMNNNALLLPLLFEYFTIIAKLSNDFLTLKFSDELIPLIIVLLNNLYENCDFIRLISIKSKQFYMNFMYFCSFL